MATPAAIACVVFDLGGVLVRLVDSWEHACRVAGLALWDGADEEEARRARHPYVVAHEEGRLPFPEYLEGLVRSTGGRYTAEECARVHRAWVLEPYPGVEGLLRELRAAGVRTGVLSNTNAVHWDDQFSGSLERPPLLSVPIDHPHASHLLGVRKPDRAIYDRFASAVALPPSALLFFDDLAANVAGARAAGWSAERIDPRGDTAAQVRGHLGERGLLPD
jgi:putative hydrolase of the HAD superfamily